MAQARSDSGWVGRIEVLVGTREGSFALGLVSALALSVSGCSATHERGAPAEMAVAPDGADAGQVPDDREPAVPLEPGCLIADAHVGALTPSCDIDSVVAGGFCQAGDAPCISYQREPGQSTPSSVCFKICASSSFGFSWQVGCASACNRMCAEPEAGVATARLDIADCAARPIEPCVDGVTMQLQLDRMLGTLVQDQGVSLQELWEDELIVHFENGCPSSFHALRHEAFPSLQSALTGPLGKARWACAMALECTSLYGGGTLAIQ